MAPAKGFVPPDVFDEYRLVRKLGQGAMGQVYLGHDTLLDRPVAIKFISALDPDPLSRERFLIEARAIARLSHPNVVAIYRVSQIGTWPYLVSEYLRGESLEKLPRPLPALRALEIGVGIAAGLAAAHKRGVLHRDVKPANVMLTETGEVKLLDFGLAKLLDSLPMARKAQGATLSTEDLALAGTIAPQATTGTPPPDDLTATRSFSDSDPSGPVDVAVFGSAPSRSPGGSSSLTNAGTLLGTPRYMAPEAWRGEPATGRTDVYSLGAILFELCTGRPPHREATLADLREAALVRDAPALKDTAPTVDAGLAAVVDRCLRRDPEDRFVDGAELHHALMQLRQPARVLGPPEGNPYRGLQAFEAQHRALFFGRSVEIRDILELLRSEPVVLVAGDSGVGKSSLCRAGVLPYLEDGALSDGRSWSIGRLVPGRRPAQALLEALLPVLPLGEDGVRRLLDSDPAALWRALRQRLGEKRGLLLFVDQSEELVTLGEAAEVAIFTEAINQLETRVPGVRLLLTARGDFLTRLVALPGLRISLSRALYLLRPLPIADLREAIIGPARLCGVRFESDALVETLADSTARARGALPLLQFALAELWDQRDEERRLIPASALARIGGVEGALSRHADGVLQALLPQERRAARRMLMRLVTADGTRARRTDSELVDEDGDRVKSDRRALEALVRGRLLYANEAEGGEGAAYEVAHEALVQGWGTLRAWLDENADRRAVLQRVEHAAAEWERLLRAKDALWGQRQIEEARGLDRGELHAREAAFLDGSRRAASARRWRRRLLVAGIPLTLALLYGGFSFKASYQLGRRIEGHMGSAMQALAAARREDEEAVKLRQRAFGLFDSRKSIEAEGAWDGVKERTLVAVQHYAQSSRALETALLLDSQRRPVRRLFAEVIYERILLSERSGQGAQVEDLRQRLAAYDEDGELRRRLDAPAELQLVSEPAGAAVGLLRIERRGDAVRELPEERLGRSPLRTQLPPGSYVLRLEAPGRAPLRAPVLLARGERLALRLPIPRRVPEGFVYIPAGRFLFGSADDDQVRRGLLTAQPLHEVTTGAYLIGRNEVTFADWIEFLRALPEPERSRRRPSVNSLHSASTINGAVHLDELPDGTFRLTLQPTVRAYVAGATGTIEYPEREHHRRQGWLRMPVSGVSWDDARAYAAWLDASGRLKGARLCDEHEWERAARGADDRLYPHGDRLSGEDANIDETYGRRPLAFGPDEVGSHPASNSPFGIADLAGNVWEWTRSLDGGLLLRGGGWYNEQLTSRSANRNPAEASLRTVDVGMRVCASPPLG